MANYRLLTLVGAAFLAVVPHNSVTATPGRLGCFYDLQLCEQNELCYNDSLFGTCVAQLSDAVNYADLEPAALNEAAQVLQYLIETGYKWQDSYTQCVVGKFLQSAVTHQRYDPEVCEYLKALLDVIDQNKGRLDQAAPSMRVVSAGPSQITGSDSGSAIEIPNGPSHGEFMSAADMATDFDQQPSPQEPMLPAQPQQQVSAEDPNAYDTLQQYVRAYQQALAQQEQPQLQSDLITAEKRSDSAVVVNSTAAPSTEVSAATPSSLLQELNSSSSDADNLQAMRALVSLVNSYPDQSGGVALFATAPELPDSSDDQQITVGIPFSQSQPSADMFRQMMTMQSQQQSFPQSGVQDIYVPDFSAIPPPEILQDMMMRSARAQLQSSPQISPLDLLIAQELFGPPPSGRANFDPRNAMMMDPRFGAGPQLDPRMMMEDPRMPMNPFMMQKDPRMFLQQDPRAYQMQADPRMMMMDPSFQQQMQMDPRVNNMMSSMPQFMMPPMERRFDPSFMPQQMMMMPGNMGMPPMKRGGQDFMPGFRGMPVMMQDPQMMQQDPRMYAGLPYGFFPQGAALPFTQQNWQPPMALPEGILFSEQGFPVLEAPATNESGVESDRQIIRELFGETEEQSVANGARGPTSPNKKDQEYRTLLPSDESQDSGAVEDVAVTVVKGRGSKPASSAPQTGNADGDDNSEDDDYIFINTQPRLDMNQARYFLDWLTSVMNVPSRTFYDVNLNADLMTFRVNPAVNNLNATYVAQTLGGDELRNGLRQTNQLEIMRAGVGRYALDDSASMEEPVLRFQQTAVVQSESAAAAEAEIAKKYDVVDPTFAFLVTEPALTYDKARRMLNWLAVKLRVPQTIFSNLHIEDHQLLFRVSPYYSQMNASGVVDQLSDSSIQAALRNEFQVEIIRSGIGDRVQIVKADSKQRQALLIGLIAVACTAAILITLAIIYFVRRNVILKKKLHGLGGDVESSKEYEELCRQRMACKNIEGGISASPDHKDRTAHSSTSSWSEEPAPTNMDITTGHMVLSYMEDHLKHKERMNEEWASLCTYEADPSKTDAGSRTENLTKNRYPDVLPYDHTRVHLNPEANATKSDYVNANLITDADPKKAVYIATQGPLPETVSDFWQMVWESNSTIVVMLTKLRENDQDLCHVYWPKEGSECYGVFEVHLVSEHIWCDDYLVRNFYLKNLQTHETRTVTQFHYLNWPNLGVPSSLKTFLEFRRKINKCYKGGSSPIVVHCSDGVDRTGAYCLIDLVLNRMAKGVKEIDIAATLEHLRDQRGDMVRTKEQFEFVLTAVAQEIQAILKSMPQK